MFGIRNVFDAVLATLVTCVGVLYIQGRRHAVKPPEIGQIRHPHELGYPSWFSQGDSPYDVRLELGREKSRILLVYDWNVSSLSTFSFANYLSRTNESPLTFDLHSEDELKAKNDHEAMVPLTNQQGECVYDWIWIVGQGTQGLDTPSSCKSIHLRYLSVSSDQPHELEGLSPEITIFDSMRHNQYDIASAPYKKGSAETDVGLVVFTLPSADPAVFYPSGYNFESLRKQVTIFVTQQTWRTRSEFADMLPSGWRGHLLPTLEGEVPTEQPIDRILKKTSHLDLKLAKQMRTSGVCVFEDWDQGILTELMVQAMLSGCVVATIQPTIQDDDLSKLFLILQKPTEPLSSMKMTFEAVEQALKTHTASEMDQKALWAFIYARQKLTFAKSLSDIVKWTSAYQEGQRGVLIPHGYYHDLQQLPSYDNEAEQ